MLKIAELQSTRLNAQELRLPGVPRCSCPTPRRLNHLTACFRQKRLLLSRLLNKTANNYFASSNPHPPHSRAYDRYNKFLRGILGGIHCSGIHWRAALAGYSAGSTRRDPLASSSCGILGGIHWRAALAGYWAGSTGKRRDPLASCSGGILGGIHWRAALAGYWVGPWCRSIANADSNIKSNNPFLPGGEQEANASPVGLQDVHCEASHASWMLTFMFFEFDIT